MNRSHAAWLDTCGRGEVRPGVGLEGYKAMRVLAKIFSVGEAAAPLLRLNLVPYLYSIKAAVRAERSCRSSAIFLGCHAPRSGFDLRTTADCWLRKQCSCLH